MLGVDPDQLVPPELQRTAVEDYELDHELWPAWQVYLGCGNQWRIAAGMGGAMWLGLDYGGVEIVMRRRGIEPEQQADVFRQLQILEYEELNIRNERAGRAQ